MAAGHRARPSSWLGVNRMTRSTQSRVKYLRLALQEAVRVGDREAAKRLTLRVIALMKELAA